MGWTHCCDRDPRTHTRGLRSASPPSAGHVENCGGPGQCSAKPAAMCELASHMQEGLGDLVEGSSAWKLIHFTRECLHLYLSRVIIRPGDHLHCNACIACSDVDSAWSQGDSRACRCHGSSSKTMHEQGSAGALVCCLSQLLDDLRQLTVRTAAVNYGGYPGALP